MKYTREFDKKIKNGALVYNTKPFLPISIKVKSLRVLSPQLEADFPYKFSIVIDGANAFLGYLKVATDIKMNTDLRIAAGRQDICFEVHGLPDLEKISGKIVVYYSFF